MTLTNGSTTVRLPTAEAFFIARGAHQRFLDVLPLYWGMAPRYDLPAETLAVQADKETAGGHYTGVVPPEFHNWCGLKTLEGGSNDDPDAHTRFPDDRTGVLAHIQHLARYAGRQDPAPGDPLVDPRWSLVSPGIARNLEDLGGHWAPADDYGRDIVARLADLRDREENPSMDRPFHVALSMGHHNTDGGNSLEQSQTPKLAYAVAEACRARGIDVRIAQDELGFWPDLGLQGVAQAVVGWDQAGWPVDLYLETHTEGAGPQARGVFAIYPDWDNDLDNDAKRVGSDAARRIANAIGIPLRNGNGLMSERETGVGRDGFRLGIFLRTAVIRDHCTRMIIEFGSHDNQDDYNAIMGNLSAVGAAVADAFAVEAVRLGFDIAEVAPVPAPQPADDANARQFPTGYWIINLPDAPILAWYDANGGVEANGLPLAGMTQRADGAYEQLCENCLIECYPGGFGPYPGPHVRRGGLGQRYVALAARG